MAAMLFCNQQCNEGECGWLRVQILGHVSHKPECIRTLCASSIGLGSSGWTAAVLANNNRRLLERITIAQGVVKTERRKVGRSVGRSIEYFSVVEEDGGGGGGGVSDVEKSCSAPLSSVAV